MVKKRSLKIKGSISIAIILLWVYFLITALSGDRYCGIWDYIANSEEDDACIAKLIKRADAGSELALNRLRYPSKAYIKRVCERGVENLSERERYYFERLGVDRCEASNFKDNKANTTSSGGNLTRGDTNATDGEENLTRAEEHNGKSDTTSSKANTTKREGNFMEEQNAGR
jgi:dihydropteroate synthetase